MKKIGAYFAVLLVLAAFGMTILVHAGDLPAVPLTGESGGDLSDAYGNQAFWLDRGLFPQNCCTSRYP